MAKFLFHLHMPDVYPTIGDTFFPTQQQKYFVKTAVSFHEKLHSYFDKILSKETSICSYFVLFPLTPANFFLSLK